MKQKSKNTSAIYRLAVFINNYFHIIAKTFLSVLLMQNIMASTNLKPANSNSKDKNNHKQKTITAPTGNKWLGLSVGYGNYTLKQSSSTGERFRLKKHEGLAKEKSNSSDIYPLRYLGSSAMMPRAFFEYTF